jgi:hypothetical protein
MEPTQDTILRHGFKAIVAQDAILRHLAKTKVEKQKAVDGAGARYHLAPRLRMLNSS